MKRKKSFLDEMKNQIHVSVLQQKSNSLKCSLSADRATLIKLFDFLWRNGFFSDEEQILRLIDRPDLLAGQVITFYNKQKKFRIEVELE